MHDFQNVVYDCWFTPYRRVTNNDSSGFEHVMVGEEKDGKITGLHNWIQYYVEEKKGNIDYLGWVGKQDQNNGDDVNLVSVAFAWADDDPETEIKPMSTSERMALPARRPACLPVLACCPATTAAWLAPVASPVCTVCKHLPVCSARGLQRRVGDGCADNGLLGGCCGKLWPKRLR
jgi:hypothetical protein